MSQDGYARGGQSRDPGKSRTPRQGLVTFALVFASAALLVFSRLDLAPVRWLRWGLLEAAIPVLSVASAPVEQLRASAARLAAMAAAGDEIEALRRENRRLRAHVWRARQLELRQAQLALLARLGRETGIEFRSARVIADLNGPFRDSILIDAGQRDGITSGMAVVNADALVGHIVDCGHAACRVLLLRDTESRIPVLIGSDAVRGILRGGGRTSSPGITNAAQSPGAATPPMRVGDDVYTSGDAGTLPRGLKIGRITSMDQVPQVALTARQDGLDVVGILLWAPPVVAQDGTARDGIGRETTTSGRLEPTYDQGRSGTRGRP